jgi:hypothetical protein
MRRADGAEGSNCLCTLSTNIIVIDVELLQLADLALAQCLAQCRNTFIAKFVVAETAHGQIYVNDSYMAGGFWANLRDFGQRVTDQIGRIIQSHEG